MDAKRNRWPPENQNVPNIVDIGHGSIRAGWSGECVPRYVLPAVVGTGNDYDVFPVLQHGNLQFPHVQQLRNLSIGPYGKEELGINKLAYIRALRGILGDPRTDDRRLLNAACKHSSELGDLEAAIKLGVTASPKDCWDLFNCRTMSSQHRKPITRVDDLKIERVLKALNRCNTMSVGMGEHCDSRPLFLIEGNQPSAKLRHEQLELAMEHIGVPALFFGQAAPLSTYIYGLSNTVVFDIGAATTSIGIVVDGDLIAYKEHHVGGDHVDALLYMLLREAGDTCLNGILHHPSYSFGTQLYDNLNEEQLPATLATKLWKNKISSRHFMIHEMIKVLKESVIQAAPYPIFGKAGHDDAKYRDILRASDAMFMEERRRYTDSTLPDGTPLLSPNHTPYTPEDIRNKIGSWVLPSSQRSTPKSKVPPRVPPGSVTNPFENVSPESLLSTAAEIIFDPRSICGRFPVEVGDFKGVFNAFDSLVSDLAIDRFDALHSAIIVGGCANMPGFIERVRNDSVLMTRKCKQVMRGTAFMIKSSQMKLNRGLISWFGASMLSSISSFYPCWITKDEYLEHGVNICRRKGSMDNRRDKPTTTN